MKQTKCSVILFPILCLLVCLTLFFMAGPSQVLAAEKPVVKLRYGCYMTKSSLDAPPFWFLEEVSKRSGFKIQVEEYFSGTLAKAPDCLDALGKGVYDLGWVSSAYTPGKTPFSMMVASACLVGKTTKSVLAANDEFVRVFPPAEAEYTRANVKYLFSTGVYHYDFIGTKAIKTLADVKGTKGRTYGYQSKAWAALGGVPVTISITEAYDALQKGMVDGVMSPPNYTYSTFRFYEVGKHFTKMNFGCIPAAFLINQNTWKKLPEAVKQAMVEVIKEIPAKGAEMITAPELGAIESMRQKGVAIHTLSDEDYKSLDKLGITIADMLVDDLTKKGVKDVRKGMDIYLKLLNKYLAQE